MELVRCRHCGLCGGVRRAVALAETLAADGWRVFTDGDLAHNGALVETLRKKGITPWYGELRDWSARECLIIRAHGISPERRDHLRSLGCKIFDGTCPEVARVAGRVRQLRRSGAFLIYYGRKGHPETEGMLGHGGEDMQLCQSIADLDNLPEFGPRPVALLAQTTADENDSAAFARAVLHRFPAAEVVDSICETCRERRREVAEQLATGSFDCAVVVGGRQSLNSQNLAKTARASGKKIFLVESAADLDLEQLAGVQRILLASGASTSVDAVDAVEAALRGGGIVAGNDDLVCADRCIDLADFSRGTHHTPIQHRGPAGESGHL